MAKKINEEKVQPLLIYPDNIQFLKGEAKLPHNSNEIVHNLRTRMGGTIAFEKNPMQGLMIYIGLLIVCIVGWIVLSLGGLDFHTRFASVGPMIRRKQSLVFSVVVVLGLGLGGFTWIVLKTLFNIMRYSPQKMRNAYALLLQQGKPLKGTVISEESVSGTFIITYQFASPGAEVLTCTYRSLTRKYKKGETNGKNVIIWYLSDTVNTLL